MMVIPVVFGLWSEGFSYISTMWLRKSQYALSATWTLSIGTKATEALRKH